MCIYCQYVSSFCIHHIRVGLHQHLLGASGLNFTQLNFTDERSNKTNIHVRLFSPTNYLMFIANYLTISEWRPLGLYCLVCVSFILPFCESHSTFTAGSVYWTMWSLQLSLDGAIYAEHPAQCLLSHILNSKPHTYLMPAHIPHWVIPAKHTHTPSWGAPQE